MAEKDLLSKPTFCCWQQQYLASVVVCCACSELLPLLSEQLIPFALVQGGVRLSVGVMSHLCYAVLKPRPQLLQQLLPHISHMLAFSLFSESVTQAAALQQQKCDVAVLLPSRAVLCAFILQLARYGLPCGCSCMLWHLL